MMPPHTIEEMLAGIYVLEAQYPKLQNVPYEDSIMVSHAFFRDLCERVIALENNARKVEL